MPPFPKSALVAIVLLLTVVVVLQAQYDREQPLGLPVGVTGNMLYVRSPEFIRRAALSYDSIVADVYWIRTIQHYGGTKLSKDAHKRYDMLYPLLDMTTSLDPKLDIAYGFGAIFLAEPYPLGAGRPDQAIQLLQKAMSAQPDKWRFPEDTGFVYYWWLHDYVKAAEWFDRASKIDGAPNWMRPLAAVTLAQGGNRESSRTLWTQILNGSDADWLKTQARFRLNQLDAMDAIDVLQKAIAAYRERTGAFPKSWEEMARAGALRGIPVDPTAHVYRLDPESGKVTLAPDSPLNPLPDPERPA